MGREPGGIAGNALEAVEDVPACCMDVVWRAVGVGSTWGVLVVVGGREAWMGVLLLFSCRGNGVIKSCRLTLKP